MAEPDAKPQTKARFDVLIDQTKAKLSKENAPKKGKKKKDDGSQISKQMLMESLSKETDDSVVRANIYDPRIDGSNKTNRLQVESELDGEEETALVKKPRGRKEKSRKFGVQNPMYDNYGDNVNDTPRQKQDDGLDDSRPLKIEDLASDGTRKDVAGRSRSRGKKTPEGRLPRGGSSADANTPEIENEDDVVAAGKKKKRPKRSASRDDPMANADQPQQRVTGTDRSVSRDRLAAAGNAEDLAGKSRKADRRAKDKRSKSAKSSGQDIAVNKEDAIRQREQDDKGRHTAREPEVGAKTKRNKDKRGKKGEDATAAAVDSQRNPDVLIDPTSPLGKVYKYKDDGNVLGVVVHRTDKLKTDFFITHPIVRVHLIDETTGRHLRKQTRDRPVTSYYESQRTGRIPEAILPVLTLPFDFKENRAIIPNWEELLIFNENFNYLTQEDPKVIVFFEILDFVSMSRASRRSKRTRGISKLVEGEGGWHKIAWAFLKLRGANGQLNVDMKARLQLYYVPLRLQPNDHSVPVYQYWSWPHREKYPSTLYVTVKSVRPPADVEPAVRSMFPTQEERGTMTAEEIRAVMEGASKIEAISGASTSMSATADIVSAVAGGRSQTPSMWARLPGQACKLPNCLSLSLPAGKLGCLVVKFSHDGKSLACGCEDKGNYPVYVYEIPSGKLMATFEGHYNNIYELDWSQSDLHLLSASSDGTARIWGVTAKNAEKMLPHPSFVYSAKFHPRVSQVVVTAGYDRLIRVWQVDFRSTAQGQLVQEIDGHASYVNSLCFNEDGDRLYTADSVGVIKVWNAYVTERPAQKGFMQDWTLNKEIIEKEIKGNDVSRIYLHPRGNRLIVHTKDNSVRLLDLRVFSVMQRYIGALNFRERVLSDVTPCGTFILSGSEDGHAYVWSTETGDQVATYTQLGYTRTVNDVAFHPHDNLAAFCSHGENHQVLIFKYDAAIADTSAEKLYEAAGGARARSMEDTDTEHFRVQEAKLDSLQKSSSAKSDFTTSVDLKKQRAMKKLESISNDTAKEFARQLERREAGMLSYGETFLTGRMTGNRIAGSWTSSLLLDSAGAVRQIQSAAAILSGGEDGFGRSSLLQTPSQSKWKPEFSAIGRTGLDVLSMRRTPAIALTPPTPKGSSAMFSFQGAGFPEMKNEVVVALYDYKAQKSDELSFARGDYITVLHKDNENWWIGQLMKGSQGYFPSNYVIASNGVGAEPHVSLPAANVDREPATGRVTAVVDKGKLYFVSDESDDDREATAGKKLLQSPARTSAGADLNGSLVEQGHRSRSRERRRNRIANGDFAESS